MPDAEEADYLSGIPTKRSAELPRLSIFSMNKRVFDAADYTSPDRTAGVGER